MTDSPAARPIWLTFELACIHGLAEEWYRAPADATEAVNEVLSRTTITSRVDARAVLAALGHKDTP